MRILVGLLMLSLVGAFEVRANAISGSILHTFANDVEELYVEIGYCDVEENAGCGVFGGDATPVRSEMRYFYSASAPEAQEFLLRLSNETNETMQIVFTYFPSGARERIRMTEEEFFQTNVGSLSGTAANLLELTVKIDFEAHNRFLVTLTPAWDEEVSRMKSWGQLKKGLGTSN